MKHTMSMRILGIILIIMLLPGTISAYADTKAIALSGSIKVYSDAELTNAVGTLNLFDTISIQETRGGVSKISVGSKTGFVSAADISLVEDIAKYAYVNTNTVVYKSPDKKSQSAQLNQGLKVNLLAQKGDWALIQMGNKIGFTYIGYITLAEDMPIQQSTVAPTVLQTTESTQEIEENVTYCNFTAYVCYASLDAYAEPTYASERLGSLEYGTQLTVKAYNDAWAYIVCGNKKGFMPRMGLSQNMPEETPCATPAPMQVSTPVPTPTPTPIPTPEHTPDPTPTAKATKSLSGSTNEEKIYLFFRNEMGLNSAAACGILSNIYYESSFRPNALNSSGGSYGICQWTGSRKTRLINYCNNNGYDYTTLTGQLYYLKYELENHYTTTLRYMRGVSNSASGAYDAGYYWCYHFEVPANRASVSVKRGNRARDTYWNKYN